ncbi:hypothetical protein [Argonema antarcticum]|uniref:hypothetical protein n=1 Tax=Argonema antarcticum TaxID=2942763 RepID=UPI002013383E|nr:hypothetical protein [Argonema antarcticum]MCL1470857.1 hypothetical protein [Argonema antarcticum A004/B2]
MKTSKFPQAISYRSLILGMILTSITAYLLVVVENKQLSEGINQVLIIIVGMTVIASLAAFKQFIQEIKINDESINSVSFSFDEAFARLSIAEGKANASNNEIINQKAEKIQIKYSPWDLNLNQLFGLDNSLALAKLRMEIEEEIRRIAYENGMDINARPIGVLGLAEELVSREYLPTNWLGVLKEIIPVCHEAIHGLDLSDEAAASIVRVGGQLLEELRLVSVAAEIRKEAFPQTSDLAAMESLESQTTHKKPEK